MAAQPPLPARTSKNDMIIMLTPYSQLTQRQKDYADMYGLPLQPITSTPDTGPSFTPVNNHDGSYGTKPVTGVSDVPASVIESTTTSLAPAPLAPPPGSGAWQNQQPNRDTPNYNPETAGLPNSAPGVGPVPNQNAAPTVTTTPITEAAATPAPVAPPVDYNGLAMNDPEYLLAIQRLQANLSNTRSAGETGKVKLKTQLQDLLRTYDRTQKEDVKNHLESAANRGMLHSGGQVERFGGINQEYADRRIGAQNNEADAELGIDNQIKQLEQNNVFDQQDALYNTINRLKGNAGNYAPTTPGTNGLTIPDLAAPAPTPVAGVPTPATAPVLPTNAGSVVGAGAANPLGNQPLPKRNATTDLSITAIPESQWTPRQRAYADMYGLRGRIY